MVTVGTSTSASTWPVGAMSRLPSTMEIWPLTRPCTVMSSRLVTWPLMTRELPIVVIRYVRFRLMVEAARRRCRLFSADDAADCRPCASIRPRRRHSALAGGIMLKTLQTAVAGLTVVFGLTLAWPLTAAAPTAKPEEVGLSTDRLKRVAELTQRHIAAGSFSGAVALVARNGRVAYHEAFGLMDIEAKKPMVKDGIFEIMSMTKPVIGVATLMMLEEGKVRLQDPVSKFIPEWRDMTVAVTLPQPPARGGGAAPAAAPAAAPGGRGGRGGAPDPRYYTVPVEREVQIRDL